MTGRWFRHYVGLHSDTKFGAVARRSRSSADRVIFVYIAALESACERNEAGSYTVSPDGLAVVCGCETVVIRRVLKELIGAGLLTKTHVVGDDGQPFQSFGSRCDPVGPRVLPLGWQALRLEILHRDRYACTYCGGPATECDHVVPRARGGSNDLDNLTAACSACNRSKGARLISEWRS